MLTAEATYAQVSNAVESTLALAWTGPSTPAELLKRERKPNQAGNLSRGIAAQRPLPQQGDR